MRREGSGGEITTSLSRKRLGQHTLCQSTQSRSTHQHSLGSNEIH